MEVKTRAPRIHFGLNRCAMNLPGGFRTFVHLAWLSDNPKAREVARRWKALSAEDKRELLLEDLCDEVRIMQADLIAAVAKTGVDLGMDVSGLVYAAFDDDIERLIARSMKPEGVRAMEQFFELLDRLAIPRWSAYGSPVSKV